MKSKKKVKKIYKKSLKKKGGASVLPPQSITALYDYLKSDLSRKLSDIYIDDPESYQYDSDDEYESSLLDESLPIEYRMKIFEKEAKKYDATTKSKIEYILERNHRKISDLNSITNVCGNKISTVLKNDKTHILISLYSETLEYSFFGIELEFCAKIDGYPDQLKEWYKEIYKSIHEKADIEGIKIYNKSPVELWLESNKKNNIQDWFKLNKETKDKYGYDNCIKYQDEQKIIKTFINGIPIILNSKIKSLIKDSEECFHQNKNLGWNHFIKNRKRVHNKSNPTTLVAPDGYVYFNTIYQAGIPGKNWLITPDNSVQCFDKEKDSLFDSYIPIEIVSPVLTMSNFSNSNGLKKLLGSYFSYFPKQVYTVAETNNIKYYDGLENIKNILETVIKSNYVESKSIEKFYSLEIKENVCDSKIIVDGDIPRISCGFHVHFSHPLLVDNQVGKYIFLNILRNFYFFEPIIFKLLHPSRENNYYCKKINNNNIEMNRAINNSIYNLDWIRGETITSICNLFCPPIIEGDKVISRKYYGINLKYARKTADNNIKDKPLQIETRLHHGTMDFDEINNWILFLTKFFSKTIVKSLKSLEFYLLNGNHLSNMFNFLDNDSLENNFINGYLFHQLFDFIEDDDDHLKIYYFEKLKLNPDNMGLISHIEKISDEKSGNSTSEFEFIKEKLSLWGKTRNGIFIPDDNFNRFKYI